MTMRSLATLLFLGGLVFLLMILTGNLSFGDPPMLVGDAIQKAAADEVGAANFVTAVVLAYRGLDTLGELSILFAAATAGGLVLGSAQGGSNRRPAGFIMRAGTDLLFPLLLVVGLYIVMHGHLTPGGGFQGGVVLAAAFFLPLLARPSETLSHAWLSLVEGLAGTAFIAIGVLALLDDKAFLTPLLNKGVLGELVSGGSLPLLYLAVGLKVGAELASLLSRLASDEATS
ncbi:MAG: MnhB domain-containing protein [Sedimenticolaceae bacterium]|jgi:multicomponent Na+:H+ antiporter subunit B